MSGEFWKCRHRRNDQDPPSSPECVQAEMAANTAFVAPLDPEKPFRGVNPGELIWSFVPDPLFLTQPGDVIRSGTHDLNRRGRLRLEPPVQVEHRVRIHRGYKLMLIRHLNL